MLYDINISVITAVVLPHLRIIILLIALGVLADAIISHLAAISSVKGTTPVNHSTIIGTSEYKLNWAIIAKKLAFYALFIGILGIIKVFFSSFIINLVTVTGILIIFMRGMTYIKCILIGASLHTEDYKSFTNSPTFKAMYVDVSTFIKLIAVYRVCVINCFTLGVPINPNILNYYADFDMGGMPDPFISYQAMCITGVCLTELFAWLLIGWIESSAPQANSQLIFSVFNSIITGGNHAYTECYKWVGGAISPVIDFVKESFIVGCESPLTAEQWANSTNIGGSKGETRYIPWHDGLSPQRSRIMLNAQFNYAKDNYPLLFSYLKDNCTQMLIAPPEFGTTGVSYVQVSHQNLTSGKYPYLTPTNSVSLIKGYNDVKAGIYFLYNSETGETYIGSTINSFKRIHHHYTTAAWVEGERPIERLYSALDEGFSSFIYAITVKTTNHFDAFIELNPDIIKDPFIGHMRVILNDFSGYECRLLEHSLITELRPSLNDPNKEVSFKGKWNPGDVFNRLGTKIDVKLADNSVIHFTGITEASEYTEVPYTTIYTYLNIDKPINSPKLGAITAYEPGGEIITKIGPINETYNALKAMPLDEDRIISLDMEPGYVYAFDADNDILGKYENLQICAKQCKISYYKLLHTLNKLPMKAILLSTGIVFFAAHIDTYYGRKWASKKSRVGISRSAPVVCINLDDRSETSYESKVACAKALGYNGRYPDKWVNRLIKSGETIGHLGVNYVIIDPSLQFPL